MGLIVAGICAVLIFTLALITLYHIVKHTNTYPPYQAPVVWPFPTKDDYDTESQQTDSTHQSTQSGTKQGNTT